MSHDIKFMFRRDISRIFDSFTDLLDIRIAFFSTDGREIPVGKNRAICTYCHLLRSRLGYERVCLALDEKRREQAKTKRHLISYTCHGGMVEAVVPVLEDGVLIGFIMIGQFRQKKDLPKAIASKWQREVGSEELKTAFWKTPQFEPEKIRDILLLFYSLVQLIVSQHMVQINAFGPVRSLLTYIEENPNQMLNLRQAAHMVHRSVSSLSHMFKQTTGKSFKQFQIEKKLDKADEYFLTEPQRSIGEVATELGYQDPLYFSKLYKRHRGHSPKEKLRRH